MKFFSSALCLFCISVCHVAFSQSGSLQLSSANPHYFSYKGKTVVLIGSGEHYGSVINKAFDYKTYLKTLKKDGLNITRLFTGAYTEKPGDFGIKNNTLAPDSSNLLLPWARSSNAGFNLGGHKFDLNKWDESYFARLKDFVTEAEKNDVIVEVNLFSAYYATGWVYSALNANNNINHTDSVKSALVNTLNNGNLLGYQEAYVKKIVKELSASPNIYFEIQNEPYATAKDTVILMNEYSDPKDFRSSLEVVSQASNNWQRRVASWIVEQERSLPQKHLISQNIGNFHYPITEPNPNVSIFNFHYAFPKTVAENYYLNKAIGFNETGFAGRADLTYRRQAWRFLMAGGALFNQLDYSFSVGGEQGLDTSYKSPGGGSPTLRAQFGFLRRFISGFNLDALQPDASLVLAAPGQNYQSIACGKGVWLVYFENLAMKTYPIKLNLPKGKYSAEWYNTITGLKVANYQFTDSVIQVPDGQFDKALVIRAI